MANSCLLLSKSPAAPIVASNIHWILFATVLSSCKVFLFPGSACFFSRYSLGETLASIETDGMREWFLNSYQLDIPFFTQYGPGTVA